MAQVVIAQKNGLMQFVKSWGPPSYMFWRKYYTPTPWKNEAMNLETLESAGLSTSLKLRLNTHDVFIEDLSFGRNNEIDLSLYKYFVVIRATKYLHRTRYYSYEHEYYSKKFHRRMSKPVFVSDINKAEFIKSRKYADEVATRCRQTGTEMVAVREVYVYRPNELLQKNIVVVVKHKTNEKMKPQFLRDYNEDTGNFKKTSKYEQAKLYTYDEYLRLYDNFHALHKNYFILPKIVNGGKPWNHKAKEVDGREQVEGTLRLRSE